MAGRTRPRRTHRMAVSAFVVLEDRFLLLKRANPPLIWAPPGGRLKPDEDPAAGVLREVSEECGLKAEILAPVGVWYGDFGRGLYVSIDYLVRPFEDQVRLSDEHVEFKWASLDELSAGQPPIGVGSASYSLIDFIRAWSLYTLKYR